MDDEQIIDLYFSRSEDALKETESKYGGICMRIARNILGNELDAEECLNDTYMALWNRIPPERPKKFLAFIMRIVKNLSLNRSDYNNAGKRKPEAELSISELGDCISDSSNTESHYDEKELREIINDFLREQTPEKRVIFIRRYWFYDQISDIAKMSGLSENNIKVTLMRLRNKLREYLSERGITR